MVKGRKVPNTVDLSNVPAELKELDRWLVWRFEERNGKRSKVPIDVWSGKYADVTDPEHWTSFVKAVDALSSGHYDGVGFVISANDPYIGIDLDNCIDQESGKFEDWAVHMVNYLPSYWEVSPSGTGIKGFIRARKPEKSGVRQPVGDGGRIEVYAAGRYFTVTGRMLKGLEPSINEYQTEFDDLYAVLVANDTSPDTTQGEWTERQNDPLDDKQILDRARNAGNGDKFKRLYDDGDIQGYDSESEATLALCRMLAFWAGPDGHVQVLRLLEGSSLSRPKLDARRKNSTWGRDTVLKAYTAQRQFYRSPEDSESISDQLVAYASVTELFCSPRGECFARIPKDGHLEVWALNSSRFKSWLQIQYFNDTGKGVAHASMDTALRTLEAMCLSGGLVSPVHVRVAGDQNEIWYDLADDEWRAIRITKTKWEIVTQPIVHFLRYSGTRHQAIPESGGDLDLLKEYLDLPSDHDGEDSLWKLVCAATVSYFIPGIEHVVLLLHGEHGAAKSTRAQFIGNLVDPNLVEMIGPPSNQTEWVQQASHRWYIILDNLTFVKQWLSDAICRAVTGEGFSKRKNYTDEEDVLFTFQRCIALTGINADHQKSDLLDRALKVGPLRKRADNMSKTQLWSDFERDKPAILGALLDAVVGVLNELPKVHVKNSPRMADFARVGVALERVLGWPEGSFMQAYRHNILMADEDAISSSTLGETVVSFIRSRQSEWKGTPSKLLEALEEHLHRMGLRSSTLDRQDWPRSAKALSQSLRQLAPNLRALGVDFSHGKSNGDRVLRLSLVAGGQLIENSGEAQKEAQSTVTEPQAVGSSAVRPRETVHSHLNNHDRGARAAEFSSSNPEKKIVIKRRQTI